MRILLLIFYTLTTTTAFSQSNLENPETAGFKIIEFKMKEHADIAIKFPFKNIRVLDYRYDTSKIGFDTDLTFWNGKTKPYQKVIVKDGLSNSLEKYYNEYYKNSFSNSTISLLIVVRKLWLINATELFRTGDSYGKAVLNFPTIKFEYYFVDDKANYIPLKRIDSTFNTHSRFGTSLNFALLSLIEAIDYNKFVSLLSTAKKKTAEEFERYNFSFFNKPILRDGNYKAGVFMNFAEFINNSPSKQLDDLKNIDSYWGYSDGKDIYIYYHHKKLYKCGNTFQYFADKVQAFGNNMLSESSTSPRIKEIETPEQIDMETGKIYQ